MIHVATVHWRSDRWIEPQLRYLERHLDGPYRIYAFLDDVPGERANGFFYSSTEPIENHATKLNLLADVIGFSASDPGDVLMFVDGDAFPVAPIAPVIQLLGSYPLIAVQRCENNGDVQPHPCFCLTTVGFWHELGGDWHGGHAWPDLQGNPVTDVGGNLLRSLELAGVDWYPLRRVNRVDVHPVFCGVYGDEKHGGLVYHHGAGFRAGGLSRVDFVLAGMRNVEATLAARCVSRLPERGVLGSVRARYNPVRRLKVRLTDEADRCSEQVLPRIERDEEFWHEFV
jgi:hypothetical protein